MEIEQFFGDGWVLFMKIQLKINSIQSIFTRNLQELGVDSIEALKYLFPSKTDDEIAAMLSGYPFRMVGEVQRAYSAFIDLINQEMRTPHPQQPNLPMAADPRLDLTPFLYQNIRKFTKRGNLCRTLPQLRPNQHPKTSPTQQSSYVAPQTAQAPSVATSPQWVAPTQPTQAPAPQVQAQMGVQGIQYNPTQYQPQTPAGSPTSGEPLQGRIYEGGRTPEFTSPVPVPGSTVRQRLQAADQANYGYQQTTPYSNGGQQTYTPSNSNSQAYSNNSSQTSQEITNDQQLLANGVSEAKS